MSNIQLMNDLNALYQHKLLLPLKLQYKDYSEWMSHRDMTKHRQYWLSQFKNVSTYFKLTDRRCVTKY